MDPVLRATMEAATAIRTRAAITAAQRTASWGEAIVQTALSAERTANPARPATAGLRSASADHPATASTPNATATETTANAVCPRGKNPPWEISAAPTGSARATRSASSIRAGDRVAMTAGRAMPRGLLDDLPAEPGGIRRGAPAVLEDRLHLEDVLSLVQVTVRLGRGALLVVAGIELALVCQELPLRGRNMAGGIEGHVEGEPRLPRMCPLRGVAVDVHRVRLRRRRV